MAEQAWLRSPRNAVLPRVASVGLAALLAWAAPAESQTIREDFPIPNGPVHALAAASGTLYVGGSFTRIGPRAPYGAVLSAATGELVHAPSLDWLVTDVVPDGLGGWFISGLFDYVGGAPHNNLAHIMADGTVAPWNPVPGSNVNAVAIDGSTVYAGGIFTEMNGATRIKAAALDAVTGALKPWNPGIDYVTSSDVSALTVSGGRVYLGGEFYILGSPTRRNIAAVHPATGAPFPWAPTVNGPVIAIAVGDSAVYLGGRFSTVGGAPRANLAAVDIVTGQVTPWNPGANGDVRALERSGSTLYVGGGFTNVAGTPRSGLASFELPGGGLTSWDPGPTGTVWSLAASGPTIYAGGQFATVGGNPRENLAAIDSATGTPTAWDPGAEATVLALAVGNGNLFAGGTFATISGERRKNLAAIDAASGAVTDWNPGTNGIVRALAVGEGPIVYAGGSFDSVGGKRRKQIAAIEAPTGVVTEWDPNSDGGIYSLALGGTVLYAGGRFSAIGGHPRARLAAIHLATGLPTSWDPGADNTVRAIFPHGGVVFVGGSFQNVGGANRTCVAALDPATGQATAWNAALFGTNPDVYALAARGPTLFVGGDFTQIGGASRVCMAALDTATAAATSWYPGASGTRYSLGLAGIRANGAPEIVYAAGDGVQVLDGETAAHFGFYPPVFGPVYALGIDGPNLFAGGDFGATGINQMRLVAATELTTPTLVAMFAAETVAEGIVLRWRFGSDRLTAAWIERSETAAGPWSRPALETRSEGMEQVVLDRDVQSGRTYHYRLIANDGGRAVTLGQITVTAGARYSEPRLTQVGPVPSSGPTSIGFVLARRCHVRLRVFDVHGRIEAELVDAMLGPGVQQAVWNGEGTRGKSPSGTYFVRLEADGRNPVRRVVLAR